MDEDVHLRGSFETCSYFHNHQRLLAVYTKEKDAFNSSLAGSAASESILRWIKPLQARRDIFGIKLCFSHVSATGPL